MALPGQLWVHFCSLKSKKQHPHLFLLSISSNPINCRILGGALDFRKNLIVKYPDVATDALYTPAKILQQQAMTLEYGLKVLKRFVLK